MTPTAFISYSWDSEDHKNWVKKLAISLRQDGVDVKLDQWETTPGDQLPHFMEKSIRENDYVLIICTKNYKKKSDNRKGGVGYEGDIMTAEVVINQNNRKFIPILKEENIITSIPNWLQGRFYIDLTTEDKYKKGYKDIITTIHGIREKAPTVGKILSLKKPRTINEDSIEHEFIDIKIKGILIDEVSLPLNNGTRGSALYKIPFELTSTPNEEWSANFLSKWNLPSRYTSMHRPGIARVSGNRIILDGTTIEEVEKYHRDTLILSVNETNKKIKKIYELRKKEEIKARHKEEEHRKKINDISNRISFD